MSPRRGRKRNPEINLSELLWALEDEVADRRRTKSEPPIRGKRTVIRTPTSKVEETHVTIDLEAAFDAAMGRGTEVTLSNQSSTNTKSSSNKRRKTRDEQAESLPKDDQKREITVAVEEESTSILLTPPKSPDHEVAPSTTTGVTIEAEAAAQLLLDKELLVKSVENFRSQENNHSAVRFIGQLAQMAHCYNHKERPGLIDYDTMDELVHFYQEAPQIRDPSNAADIPCYFLPQKHYLMRRQVRERLYGAVSFLKSQQTVTRPVIPEAYKYIPEFMAIVEGAAATSRNYHTLILLLEDLHSIPDL